MKHKIFFIGGGMTFKNKKEYLDYLSNRDISLEPRKKWSEEYLNKKLFKDFDLIRIRMPLKENAKYLDWKINFERYLNYFDNKTILIGYSLGGIFLAKYLSENKLNKKILSVYLVAPPYDNTLSGEDLCGGFRLKSDLSLLEKTTKNLYFLFSFDDTVVPIFHLDNYNKKLRNAKSFVYNNKNGHFIVEEFPELVKMLKSDIC